MFVFLYGSPVVKRQVERGHTGAIEPATRTCGTFAAERSKGPFGGVDPPTNLLAKLKQTHSLSKATMLQGVQMPLDGIRLASGHQIFRCFPIEAHEWLISKPSDGLAIVAQEG